jgi:hypothetical protein
MLCHSWRVNKEPNRSPGSRFINEKYLFLYIQNLWGLSFADKLLVTTVNSFYEYTSSSAARTMRYPLILTNFIFLPHSEYRQRPCSVYVSSDGIPFLDARL